MTGIEEEPTPVVIKEVGVLEKFDGEPLPENLVERIYIEDGEIIKVEKLEGEGNVISSEQVKEVT